MAQTKTQCLHWMHLSMDIRCNEIINWRTGVKKGTSIPKSGGFMADQENPFDESAKI